MDATTPGQEVPKPKLQVTRMLDRYRYTAKLGGEGYEPERLETIHRALNLLTPCRTGRLGSHLYLCNGCDRSLIGLNSCNNRHCPCCGEPRRDKWRTQVNAWSLQCNFLHIVFTLPHELNALLFVNPRELYKLMCRVAIEVIMDTCRREFGCVPGVVLALHTWGQRMNLHVHCHVIVTEGGLSLDGSQWINIPADHPAIQGEALAVAFRKKFLRRLRHRLERNLLHWPTLDTLPVDPAALGMLSYPVFPVVDLAKDPLTSSVVELSPVVELAKAPESASSLSSTSSNS